MSKIQRKMKRLYKLEKQLTKLEKRLSLNIYNEIILEKQLLKSKRRKKIDKIGKLDKKIDKTSKILILLKRLDYSIQLK